MGSRSTTRWWRRVITVAVAGVIGSASVLVGSTPAMAAAPYTALGDSYTSGLGTEDYYDDGTDCYRSRYAYPELTAQRLGASLTFAACSGARTYDVRDKQLGSLNSSTQYVSLQVGGNDAGFSSVITQCAKPWPYTCWGDIDNAQAFIRDTLPGRLDELYGLIKSKAPNARVVVVGYPRLFNGEECNVISRISSEEQAELNATADLLSTTIQGRAQAAGFIYVDPRPAFIGHAVCDDTEWINGASWPINESYHPNRAGHVGYTDLVEPRLRNGAAGGNHGRAVA